MAGKQVVDKIQLGNSGTPANNFLISTLNDGTMKIQRGNDGGALTDVLTVDANGVITPVKFSLGRTRQNVTASRVYNTTYTNTDPTDIEVVLSVNCPTSANISMVLDGVNLGQVVGASTAQIVGTITVTIPPNGTYRFNNSGSPVVNSWTELRKP